MGRQVQFWDSVLYASNSLSMSWDFGDGNTATGSQAGMGATHTYAAAGTYTVTFCVYDSVRNDTACVIRSIVVNAICPQVGGTLTGPDTLCIGAPSGTFVANPTSGSSNPQYSYRWWIGSSFYSFRTVTHTFTSPGTYGVTLEIIDWSIPDTAYIYDTVVVLPGNACLQPLQVSIQAPDTVCLSQMQTQLLNATVSGGNGQYIYDWSDSRGGRSTRSTHFVWTQTPQTITVILDVFDGSGLFFGSDTVDIVFTFGGSCPPISPNFGFWPNPTCVGQPITLWDSTGILGPNFASYFDMGDGTIYHTSQVTHVYNQGGTYAITYCIIDSAAQDTFCTTDSIVVNARCWTQIHADSLFVTPDSVCPGQSMNFFGTYSGGPMQGNVLKYWDFGDGNSATGSTATHAYSQSGTYTVQYCVVDTIYGDTSCVSRAVFILGTCADTVSGYLFYDANQDGSYNAGDAPLGGYPVIINPGGSMAFADAQGHYEMALAPGTYTVNAANIPNYTNTSPASGNYTHTLSGNFTNQQGDFGYDTLTTSHDLDVWLYCSTPRPGFPHWISVYFSNQGADPVSGTITLSYDPQTTFQYTTPLNSGVHDPVNHTVSWTFNNLPTGIYRQRVRAWFSLPATVPLGNVLNNSVRIDPVRGDTDITNNLDACSKTVVGSYDPNDKMVDQPVQIQGDEWLLYTIRFQNTGTDTAFNVVVRDALDSDLDLGTFQMLGASHQYTLNIEAGNEAVWTFNNILLPDSGTSYDLSQGHIMYRIKPKPGLVPGTNIHNSAAIYFDFNSPIITNTTTNSIAFPVTIDDDFEQKFLA
ncbi:MAG: PKD domain-containing protein [Bacteroidia bacterium]